MSGPGLVKKLLFPAYADAGSSDTFTAKEEADAEAERLRRKDEGKSRNSEKFNTIQADNESASMDDMRSEATTAVLDNRTSAALESNVDVSRSTGPLQSSQPDNESASMDDMHSEATTAVLDNRTSAALLNKVDVSRSTGRSQSSQPSIQTSIPPSTPANLETPYSEQRAAVAIAATSSPFFPSTAPPITRPIAARSASTTTFSGSAEQPFAAASLRRPDPESSTSPQTTSHVTASSLEQNPYAQDGVRQPYGVGSFQPSNQVGGDTRVHASGSNYDENQSDIASDVLSTASEFGTVINISSRMAEVNAMALMTPVSMAEEDSQSESGDGEVAASLSLPILDETYENDEQDFVPSFSWDEGTKNKVPPSPSQNVSTSAAAMVSAAFRRIGTGVGTLGKSGAVSAPTTPRGAPRVEDYLSSYRSKDHGTPPSLLLRSPGSAAYSRAVNRSKKPVLSPRFTGSKTSRTPNSVDRSSLKQHQESSLVSPLRYARGCFSFDNTIGNEDSSMQGDAQLLQSRIPQSRSLSSPVDMHLEPKVSHLRNLMQSKSWDMGSNGMGARTSKDQPFEYASAFRAIPGNTRVLNGGPAYYKSDGTEPTKGAQNFSPAINTMENSLALRTPQRVVIEREDALDILACLVERSIAFEKESIADTLGRDGREKAKQSDEVLSITAANGDISSEIAADDDKVSTFAAVGTRSSTMIASPPKNRRKARAGLDILESGALSTGLVATVNELRYISRVHDVESDHDNRMETLDELLRSHIYAGEMKQAARSASTWLRSIGRASDSTIVESLSSGVITENGAEIMIGETVTPDDNEAQHDVVSPGSKTDTKQFEEKMDVLTVRAMLHSVELQLKEKADESLRLNAELTECRAEIGRLKSSSNAGFRSPNCSMFDNDDESEVSDIVADLVNSRVATNTEGVDQSERSWDDAKTESNLLRSALVEANNTIRKLHATGQQQSLRSGDSFGLPEKAPVVPIPPLGTTKDPIEEYMNGHSMEVGDPESFVTRWAKESPLPPSPDHNLNSPIVTALLKQWTMDSAMHHSLLTWISRVLQGADPESIPPLTISSLDRPVRDGMLTHILPLLLKRPDILLDVQTRAQRRTTYDLSVTIHRNMSGRAEASKTPKAGNKESFAYNARHTDTMADRSLFVDESWKGVGNSEVGTSSVAHSAVTAHISNSFVPVGSNNAQVRSSGSSQLPVNPEVNALSGYESNTAANNQRSGQPGLMSAINNRFGGLLNRGKKVPSQQDLDNEEQSTPIPSSYSWNAPSFPNEDMASDDPIQPYQRVLSCPPGRIGVTFVQYRGHAMVSDVSPESPLSGWVFASDILIAIDEVPVSGMRVRDIVKLLTARKDRQRALRVISSHAMNEFTLNTSVLSEPAI